MRYFGGHKTEICSGLQMAAEIRLFETALEDPLNERFMLLSETCIPMYPGTLVWAELLSEGRSRINSCRDPDPRAHYNVAMEYRQGISLS